MAGKEQPAMSCFAARLDTFNQKFLLGLSPVSLQNLVLSESRLVFLDPWVEFGVVIGVERFE